MEKWKGKSLHGQYPKRSQQADVDQDKTHHWLRAMGETVGFIMGAQDQSLLCQDILYLHQINIRPYMLELDYTYTGQFASNTTHRTLTNGMNIKRHP